MFRGINYAFQYSELARAKYRFLYKNIVNLGHSKVYTIHLPSQRKVISENQPEEVPKSDETFLSGKSETAAPMFL